MIAIPFNVESLPQNHQDARVATELSLSRSPMYTSLTTSPFSVISSYLSSSLEHYHRQLTYVNISYLSHFVAKEKIIYS